MTKYLISRAAGVLAILAAVSSAQAHPGHSLSESKAAHVLSSPYHLAILALGGALMIASAQLVRRDASRRLLLHGGAVALMGAVVLGSLPA